MLNGVFPHRFFKMELIRYGTPPTPHQHRQRTCDAARNGSKRKRHRACFSSHCGTSRDQKCAAHASLLTVSEQQVNSRLKTCAPPIVHRSDVSPRKKHVSNNPVLPWFQLLEKLTAGSWRELLFRICVRASFTKHSRSEAMWKHCCQHFSKCGCSAWFQPAR